MENNGETTNNSDVVESTEPGSVVDPLTKSEKVEAGKGQPKAVVLPSGKYNTLINLLNYIDTVSGDDFKKNYTKEEASATGVNINSIGNASFKDTFQDTVDKEVHYNDIKDDGTEYNIKSLNVKAAGVLTGDAAIAKFSSALGIGSNVHVPLWNTGIWVTIRPPKDSDLINLEAEIASNQITLGRETNTLVFSNYSVVFARIVTDFIIGHITATSVDLPDDVDIRELITVQDLPTLIIGLIAAAFPNGYPIIKTCRNTLEIVDKKPACDFSVTGTVDPIKMLFVNKKGLSKENLTHMSKKAPGSVPYADVIKYKESIFSLKTEEVESETNIGRNIMFTLKSPSIADYVDNGEEWIDNIILQSEELFSDKDIDETKNAKVREMLNSVVLGVYNIYVSKLEYVDDGTIVEDRATINSIIDLISSDEKVLAVFLERVKAFISKRTMSVIATPNFDCPKCKEAGREYDQNPGATGPFKEFIVINPLEHFFDLSALRTLKVRERVVS